MKLSSRAVPRPADSHYPRHNKKKVVVLLLVAIIMLLLGVLWVVALSPAGAHAAARLFG